MRARNKRIVYNFFLYMSAIAIGVFVVPIRPAHASQNVFYLHGAGANDNPLTLFADSVVPNTATAKYRDSGSVNFSGGNSWQAVGTWAALPSDAHGALTSLDDMHIWVGLKNSDDVGTRFDVRTDVYKNSQIVASGISRCIANVVRNPSLAKEVTTTLSSVSPGSFNGISDQLSLRVSARIGTNQDDSKCLGHNSAAGLRAYFDATSRQARFGANFVPSTASGKAYVTNTSTSSNSVSVIDLATNQIIKTIPVGNQPRGISYHPGTHRAYAVNTYGSRSVSVIDTISDTVIETISLGDTLAFNSAISPDGTRLYLVGVNEPHPALGANLTVIDTTTNTVTATIYGFVSGGTLTVSPDGSKVYYVDNNCCFEPRPNGYLRVVDTASLQIETSVEVGKHPVGVAVTHNGSKIYVTNPASQNVSVIDTATYTVTATIPIPEQPDGNPTAVIINSTDTRAYIATATATAHTVYTIDTVTNTIIASVQVGPTPHFLALSTDDSTLYSTDTSETLDGGNSVSVIDTATNLVVDTIIVGYNPWDIATQAD
jgi:YVTN family beta-propeller protein